MTDPNLSLSEVPLFQGLGDLELADVLEKLKLQAFGRGEDLLQAGRQAPGIFVIKSGAASAIVKDDSGGEREVATLGRGECAGEMAFLTGEPPSADVRAVTETEAWLLEAEDLQELLEENPALWRNLGQILSRRLARTSRHLLSRARLNLVPLIADCDPEEATALAFHAAESLARQTGKKVLLAGAGGGHLRRLAEAAGVTLSPSFSSVLHFRSLLTEHEAPADPGNSLSGARVAEIDGEQVIGSEDFIAALDLISPLYGFILILERPGPGRLHPLVAERARSVMALVTQGGDATPPTWLASLLDDPALRQKVEVAMVPAGRGSLVMLEALEERLGKAVVRLPISTQALARMADAGTGEVPPEAARAVDRLARQIGEIEVGLALGAGAAKGFAHIGVLRVLEEAGIPIDYLAGCSIGSVVGAMYGFGMSLDEIEAQMQGADRKLKRWTLPFRSLWSDAGLKEMLRNPAPTLRFRDLQLPFAVVATDVVTGREAAIRKGLVWRAVQASTSVPGIFPAVALRGRHLVDGGLVNPVPSQTVRHLGADIVIAVDLMSPSGRGDEASVRRNGRGGKSLPNLVEMLWRANEIMQEEVTLRSAATADVTIAPKLGQVRWSDFSQRGKHFITLGEQATREKMPEVRDMLRGAPAPAAG